MVAVLLVHNIISLFIRIVPYQNLLGEQMWAVFPCVGDRGFVETLVLYLYVGSLRSPDHFPESVVQVSPAP